MTERYDMLTPERSELSSEDARYNYEIQRAKEAYVKIDVLSHILINLPAYRSWRMLASNDYKS